MFVRGLGVSQQCCPSRFDFSEAWQAIPLGPWCGQRISIRLGFSLQNGIKVRDWIDSSVQMASWCGGPNERHHLPESPEQKARMGGSAEERPAVQNAAPIASGGEGQEVRAGVDQGQDVGKT